MTLLDHVVLQVDDLDAIGDWYDRIVGLAGGERTFDMPNLIGYALPGQPAQLFFSLATDAGGRQTHLALRVADEATVRLGYEFATTVGAEILHAPRAVAGIRAGLLRGLHPRSGRKQPRTQVPGLSGTVNARDVAHHVRAEAPSCSRKTHLHELGSGPELRKRGGAAGNRTPHLFDANDNQARFAQHKRRADGR